MWQLGCVFQPSDVQPQSLRKDTQQTPSSGSDVAFGGADPAAGCVGSGIFVQFLTAQCRYAEWELVMKGVVWKEK